MEGPPLGAGEGAGSKRKREKEEKKRKKREKKERKKEKKRRKKEKKREKKKRKKEKKAARKGESSSSSSGSDDSSSDEGPERGEVPPFDPAAFERVVRDVLFVNPAMKAALKQVMLALDSGTGINLAGLQNPAVKRSLQNVFDVLPLMAHRNGERSLPKASGMSAHALLSETIEKIESRAAPGATAPGATAAPTAVTQFNEDEDDGEGFGPQLSTSGNLREGRAFTEEEMERAKAAASSAKAGKLHSGGGVKRGAWMTELPKGRDVFSQATSSKGSRQFMQRTVERTLATDQEVNMWTATPKQRQELQAKEADRVLLGYGAQPTRGGGGGGSSSPSSAKLEQARAEAVSAKFYRGGAASAVAAAKPPKAGEEGGVTRTWDRERDLLNGSVDTNHLNAVVKGASKMGSRFASSQRLE